MQGIGIASIDTKMTSEKDALQDFKKLVEEDWLAAFCQYGSYGEASQRLTYWVGVSTVAAALGRKVWFDQDDFQWSPNFYILIVGEQGAVRKSTSIDVGMRLLKQVEGIVIGPSSATWQAFVERTAECFQDIELPDGSKFRSSCMTLPLSEFGTFFKPDDQDMIDVLTDLWDGKLGAFEKITKTNGSDIIENPWINIIAATTPKWVSRKLTDDLIGGGLISRFIFLHGEMPERDVAYPKRNMPRERAHQRKLLVEGLRRLADAAGPVELTEEAYAWGEDWYSQQRQHLRTVGFGTLEAGFLTRKQVHLHKLAMVIAAARNSLPTIGVGHLQEAERRLAELDDDTRRVFGVVGQTKVTAAARQIVDAVVRSGPVGKRKLYRTHFYRTMEWGQYEEAVKSAVHAELIVEMGDMTNTVLMLREVK